MRKFILGTDWWTDCDDVVAVRLLARAAMAGQIQLCGIGINACMTHSVVSLQRFLESEGLRDIPLGIDLTATDFGGDLTYQPNLAGTLYPQINNACAMDAVRLYRKILAETEGPIEIIEIGFLQVIAAVLQSPPDDLSDLDGITLFREKVAKVWVMAGKWDGDGEREHNFCLNDRSRLGGHIFCKICPVPVTFLGWEIGINVLTGDELDENDLLHHVLVDHGSANGRHSWDPMLVMLALIGDEEKAGYRSVCGTASLDPVTGENHFAESPDGLHCYVVKTEPNVFYEDMINDAIQ